MISAVVLVALAAIVLLGVLPTLLAVAVLALSVVHRWYDHLDRSDPGVLPRVVVVVPAWNEVDVLRYSVDRLLALDYPSDRLRVVVVDDGSTDGTAELLAAKQQEHGDRLVPLRRENGGQGKAHTVNHGLDHVLGDDWAEAVLLTDADVVFEQTALRRMTRHLADPDVGAVTAYIREASRPASLVTRYVAFEYAVAQLGARRASNVIDAHACLAGGAQLHRRRNLEVLGGRIDTTTLAEDTVTTFQTQLAGRRVVFDPHALALAEEPADLRALWKQRLRWARGNLQVTRRFHRVFFRRSAQHVGNPLFGAAWFALLLLPAIAIASSVALVALWFADSDVGTAVFRVTWVVTALGAVFTAVLGLLLDRNVTARSWFAALTFHGLLNVGIMAFALAPVPLTDAAAQVTERLGLDWDETQRALELAVYCWVSLCMLAAWATYRLQHVPGARHLVPGLLLLVGYGPMLCAVIVAAYVAELRRAPTTWDKTVKVGRVEQVAA